MQQGPCLPWCARRLSVPIRLAAASAVAYVAACAYYYVRTRSFGTPFFDSLTERQRALYEESRRKRGRVFCEGSVVGLLCVAFLSAT